VIFGAGAVAARMDGMDGNGALWLLTAFAAAACLLSPFAAAGAVRANMSN
jgi:ABC-type transport system involved in cytochrome c biogenesis permease component